MCEKLHAIAFQLLIPGVGRSLNKKGGNFFLGRKMHIPNPA
jgi:hypothetical protein